MRIAVATPAGHIGRNVVDYLLEAGVDVRLLVRHPEKVDDFVDRGAKLAVGSLENETFLTEALRDVDALCWVTPPCYHADKLREVQNRLGRSAAGAVRANGVGQLVNISSVGAHLNEGTGPIKGLRDVERLLEVACDNVTHLRPGFFFENFFWQLDAIAHNGCVYLPLAGSVRYPMIAAADIARVAAGRLMDTSWSGICIRELHGPADLSFDQAAALISEGLGHKVVFLMVEPEQAARNMHASGMSEDSIREMLELYASLDSGLLRPAEPRSARTTTTTTLLEFARNTLAPMLPSPVTH